MHRIMYFRAFILFVAQALDSSGVVATRLSLSRRHLMVVAVLPTSAVADTGLGYVDDAGAVSYSQVQRAWEKAAKMSDREKLLAARGVAILPKDPTSGDSERSRKRRAMGGCHDDVFRKEAGCESEAQCNRRVLNGDMQFILDVMAAQ